jgi:hypothetical protein
MQSLKSPSRIAGLLLLWAAIWILAIWGVLLVAESPPGVPVWNSVKGQLHYIFLGGNPHRAWHFWMAVLPILCIGLGVAYFKGVARRGSAGRVMFGIVLLIAALAWIVNDWTIALMLTLPLYWAFRAARHPVA